MKQNFRAQPPFPRFFEKIGNTKNTFFPHWQKISYINFWKKAQKSRFLRSLTSKNIFDKVDIFLKMKNFAVILENREKIRNIVNTEGRLKLFMCRSFFIEDFEPFFKNWCPKFLSGGKKLVFYCRFFQKKRGNEGLFLRVRPEMFFTKTD